MALIRAELQKLFTTRLWWVMLLVMLAYVGVSLGFIVGFAGQAGQNGAPGLPGRADPQFQQLTWGLGLGGALFVMILGVVMMTSEYRYQTVTSTFLITPRRERVIVAKLLAGVVIGLLFGVAALLLTAATVIPAVLASGGTFDPVANDLPRITVGVLAALTLYTLFGIGLGALIRNQIGAIMTAVAWVFIVETIVNAVPPLQPFGRWTPAGAAAGITNTGVDLGQGAANLLSPWAGALVLLGYALLFASVASVTTLRRDIT